MNRSRSSKSEAQPTNVPNLHVMLGGEPLTEIKLDLYGKVAEGELEAYHFQSSDGHRPMSAVVFCEPQELVRRGILRRRMEPSADFLDAAEAGIRQKQQRETDGTIEYVGQLTVQEARMNVRFYVAQFEDPQVLPLDKVS